MRQIFCGAATRLRFSTASAMPSSVGPQETICGICEFCLPRCENERDDGGGGAEPAVWNYGRGARRKREWRLSARSCDSTGRGRRDVSAWGARDFVEGGRRGGRPVCQREIALGRRRGDSRRRAHVFSVV